MTNSYDRLGRLATIAHNGITTTKSYNGASQLLSESYSGGSLGGLAVTNDYDSFLRRNSTRAAGYASTLNSYTYDTANRLATVGNATYSATYTYLANSPLLSQVVYKESGSTRLTSVKQYDFADRLQLITSTPSGTNTAAFTFGYLYNSLDQRARATAGDGSYWSYGYDALGQLTNGVRRWVDHTLVEGEQFSYAFDDIGNRKSTRQGGNTAGAFLRSANYTNNTLNQITTRTVPNAVDIIGTSTAPNVVTVNGNVPDYRQRSFFREELSVTNVSGPAWTPVTVVADTTKIGHILTPPAMQTFSYDADGNLTNDLVWRYIWDGENRLTEIQPLTNNPAESKRWLKYSYDWRSRRIQKTAASWNTNTSAWSLTLSNRFLYTGWNLLGELNATNNNLIRGYIWGLDLSGTLQGAGGVGGLVAINDTANGAQFAAYDDTGNVVGFVKGSDGSVSAQYEYDPFGQLIRATGPFAQANPLRFSTKYFDDEIGLSYYGYRYYNPSLGRWLNRDPIEEWGGANIYGFVWNEPTHFVDILGLELGDWWDPRTWSRKADGSPLPLPSRAPAIAKPGWIIDDEFEGGKDHNDVLKEIPKKLGEIAVMASPIGEEEVLMGLGAKIASKCKLGTKLKEVYNRFKAAGERTAAENKKARNFFKNNKDAAKKAWEERTGREWPKDENGHDWPAHHEPSLKSGGDPMHVQPQNPNGPDPHSIPGADGKTDYQRWGAQGTPAREAKRKPEIVD